MPKDKIIAHRSARKAGEIDHQAFMAAMRGYEDHEPGDSGAGRMFGLIIRVTTEQATDWFERLMINPLRYEGPFNDDQE